MVLLESGVRDGIGKRNLRIQLGLANVKLWGQPSSCI
jgi:hypothetical protein